MGFTLIEMLVAIAIIALLLGIGLAVGPAVLSKGEEQKTRVTLVNAQAVLEEYLRLTGQSADDAFASAGNLEEAVDILFDKASNIKRMEPMFNSFDERTLVKNASDEFTLNDSWDNAIVLKWDDSVGNNLPDAGQPYFASRGPDGQWGDVNAADGSEADRQEADNFYSHEIYE